jgi:hypothetical protein
VKRKRENNTYDATTRAEIGRYATEHGHAKAARHFSKVLGLSVGESAVRVIKKAYIKSAKDGDGTVTELNHGRKGRPLLLVTLYRDVLQFKKTAKFLQVCKLQFIKMAKLLHFSKLLKVSSIGKFCNL